MLKEFEHTLTLRGMGETKEQAFHKILQQVQSAVAKEFSDVVIRIEPKDIEVVSAKETSYKERFFGIFFPRTRTRYEIVANVSVRLCLVGLSDIPFQVEKEMLSPTQRILRMR